MPSLGRKGEQSVFCFTSDFPTVLLTGNHISKPSRSRAGAGPPRAPSRAAGGTSGRRCWAGPEGGRPKVGAALPCAALRGSPRLPADGVRLAGLRLRGAGGGGRCRGLRQGRWVPLAVAVPAVPARSPRSAPGPLPAVTPLSPHCAETVLAGVCKVV